MALTRWRSPGFELDPFRNLTRIHDEINRLFDFSFGRSLERGGIEAEWAPAVDVYEDENTVFIKAELPGMTEKDIEVNIADSTLVIKNSASPRNRLRH